MDVPDVSERLLTRAAPYRAVTVGSGLWQRTARNITISFIYT